MSGFGGTRGKPLRLDAELFPHAIPGILQLVVCEIHPTSDPLEHGTGDVTGLLLREARSLYALGEEVSRLGQIRRPDGVTTASAADADSGSHAGRADDAVENPLEKRLRGIDSGSRGRLDPPIVWLRNLRWTLVLAGSAPNHRRI
jgi:hypothetical protein